MRQRSIAHRIARAIGVVGAVFVVASGAATAESGPALEIATAPIEPTVERPPALPERAVAPTPEAGPESGPESGPEAGARQPSQSYDGALVLVLGGDLGLGGSNEPVHPDGGRRHGVLNPWTKLTAGLAPLINGDLNFANLETVVTTRNDLRANPKAFNFRSHPAGIRHLVGLGFNVFSTANNHALDYGDAGVRETLHHLEDMQLVGLRALPGLGLDYDHAARAADLTVKGSRVRFSAIGIGGNHIRPPRDSGTGTPGMLNYLNPEDYRETVARLAAAEGDLRILSVHYGMELGVRPAASDIARLRDLAVRQHGVDIVAGHHAHVVAGVQQVDGRIVFYGLGNLLHPGMQNMSAHGICRDYGLIARIHLSRADGGRLRVRAIEVVPIVDMHLEARPLTGEAGQKRVEVLNHLASSLDDSASGATGVRFVPQADGRGLHCLPGADTEAGRIGMMCAGWRPPPPPPAALQRTITAACNDGSVLARRSRAPFASGSRPDASGASRVAGPAARPDGAWMRTVFGGY